MPIMPNRRLDRSVSSTSAMPLALLIDSREERVEMMTIALSESLEDLAVVTAPDAGAALAMLDAPLPAGSRPSLVILSGGSPVAALIETLRELKDSPSAIDIEVLVLATAFSAGDYQRCIRMGAVDLLQEPDSLDGYLRLASGLEGLLSRI